MALIGYNFIVPPLLVIDALPIMGTYVPHNGTEDARGCLHPQVLQRPHLELRGVRVGRGKHLAKRGQLVGQDDQPVIALVFRSGGYTAGWLAIQPAS